ncbi:nuclear protein localization factor and ER translocation component [Suhomyces tanzawaensis NRRL Y-17324]|uniref:Nuclear protein localization protein 4 n=1 Tax=Suhomyces tanzawaensis NRRL Y-17324 TaxID=984487 RepID=A0A1E4SPF7_9ASCO|nr:nuclear protein localization factor and ER translocation component [Suhomyces tanzawaensis NRRL Y-17324]ODV81385.1 nuclear protein localization factor and ER translocation component [Suhomyces tanzawaensis NRRL Y-17324]
MIILRFRSKDGMFRISADPQADFLLVLEELFNKLKNQDPQLTYISDKPGQKGELANSLCGKSVELLGLKNGDMLYVTGGASASTAASAGGVSVSGNTVSGTVSIANTVDIKKPDELKPSAGSEVDAAYEKSDGLIKRPRSTYCRHGDKGMCEYCSPLPPWDANYRKENSIKHMSFHAHLKELNDAKNNRNNASSYIHPLDEANYKIDLTCTNGHKAYPRGICSKCQPSPITLQLQKFRMVDHVEYSDFHILNKFIDSWRQTGVQRYGVLYGRYEAFDKVPLGIKAVVEAIYEPPQAGEADGITLLPWENQEQIDSVAQLLGMYQVGVVFTDLTDSGNNDGTVLCKRHKDSYFLTNLEILMAARNQAAHPLTTRHSSSGKYSSKFVTSVISGGLKGEIGPRSFQVSASAEALVKAEIMSASTQPSKLLVNSNNDTRYVPDISYLEINEYGLEVKSNAKPAFPVDFLLVSLTDSFPLEPKPFFNSSSSFPIENRDFMGELQNLPQLYLYLNGGAGNGENLCDLHFLGFVAKTGILGPDELQSMLRYVKDRDEGDYLQLVESPGWMTLLTIAEQSS